MQTTADWGTYVCAHVDSVEGIQRAIRAGVRSIEHGHFVDEETSDESARGIYSPSAAVGRNGFVRGQRVPRIVRQPRARNTTSVASGERRVPDPARPRFIADPEPEFQGDLCIEN